MVNVSVKKTFLSGTMIDAGVVGATKFSAIDAELMLVSCLSSRLPLELLAIISKSVSLSSLSGC
jgi:hypothetical protein